MLFEALISLIEERLSIDLHETNTKVVSVNRTDQPEATVVLEPIREVVK